MDTYICVGAREDARSRVLACHAFVTSCDLQPALGETALRIYRDGAPLFARTGLIGEKMTERHKERSELNQVKNYGITLGVERTIIISVM
jgi:hypothetical protein